MVQRAGAGETGLHIGSDYFIENFQVKENKTKMEKYSSALFSFAFLRVEIRV